MVGIKILYLYAEVRRIGESIMTAELNVKGFTQLTQDEILLVEGGTVERVLGAIAGGITGALGGAVAGGKTGANLGSAAGPKGKLVGTIIGGVVGGIGGALTGIAAAW